MIYTDGTGTIANKREDTLFKTYPHSPYDEVILRNIFGEDEEDTPNLRERNDEPNRTV